MVVTCNRIARRSKYYPGNKNSKCLIKGESVFSYHYLQGEFSQALPDQLTWSAPRMLMSIISINNKQIILRKRHQNQECAENLVVLYFYE